MSNTNKPLKTVMQYLLTGKWFQHNVSNSNLFKHLAYKRLEDNKAAMVISSGKIIRDLKESISSYVWV